jgi:dipeptidyl aminopeptidase/acylaminoacyl peptidase
MTSPRRFEQDLPALLADLYVAGTPDYRDDLVQQTARARQRPAWMFPERWLPVDITNRAAKTPTFPWRQLGVLALIGLLLASALAVYVGSQPRIPDPFGLARTGLQIYTRSGDIFVRDGFDGAERQLMVGPETDIAVSASPLGRRLLTAREVPGGHELWVSPMDGSSHVKIGGPYADMGRIEWSPDESQVAVTVGVGIDGSTIKIVAADGSGERDLVTGMDVDEPTWRPPDGRQIAFRGKVDGNWTLFTVGADGVGSRRLDVTRDLMEAPYEVLAPAWSPDGTRIAYHRLVPTPGEGNGNGFRIAVATIDPDGGLVGDETFTFDSRSDDEFNPNWTADGARLVFLRRDGSQDSIAMAAPREGARMVEFGVTSTGDVGGLGYSLTPDGRTIAAHVWQTGADRLIDVDSGAVTDIEGVTDDGIEFQRIAN